jgi:hypothetical protein
MLIGSYRSFPCVAPTEKLRQLFENDIGGAPAPERRIR